MLVRVFLRAVASSFLRDIPEAEVFQALPHTLQAASAAMTRGSHAAVPASPRETTAPVVGLGLGVCQGLGVAASATLLGSGPVGFRMVCGRRRPRRVLKLTEITQNR